MAEARKKAARRRPDAPEKKGGGRVPAASKRPPAREQPTAWEARAETFVFPEDNVLPSSGTRIQLPSSGTAEEILGRASAKEIVPAVIPAAEPGTPAVEAQISGGQAISFFTSAAQREEKVVEASEHLATFYLDNEEYGVDVKLVQEIIRIPDVTQVPRAPEFIRGVINLRGRIIPVVDLKRKLGLGRFEPSRQARIVVVRLRDRLVGILVDAASQVLKIPVAAIEAAPEETIEIDASAVRGVAKLSDRLIILLELAKVLAIELRESAALSVGGSE